MAAAEPCIDTSALAKRYLNEPGSEAFDAFLGTLSRALISRLTIVELHCLLRRRWRAGEIDDDYERAARAHFADDVRRGYFEVEPLADRHAMLAHDLIDQLSGYPLRTLDALHLAIAHGAGVRVLATADREMARAAEALGIGTVTFG
jgi:predicted nucleic acid-binding protein